ncbi:hypothetical protein [Methylorubrum sp. SB2]|uniref:hypothetical protein n=1 Tax=Methylorubrum subtropicum TaxID=3138812 RepID=UPI00313D5303
MASRPVSGRAVTMLRRGGAAALLLGAGLQGASAQGYSWGYGPEDVYGAPRAVYRAEPALSPRSVAYSLQDRGFTEIGRPRFDGRAYIVEATGPRGARLRLVVDARDGAVIGREVVGEPYYPTAIRPRPVTPGYGWTEEDDRPRRFREAERLVPPADIPSAVPAPSYRGLAPDEGRVRAAPARPSLPRQEANAGIAPPSAPEANPYGLNPDAAARPDAARRAAKAPPPAKAPVARVAPPAPAPSLRPTEPAAKAEEKPVESAPAKSAEPAEPANPVKTAESAPALAPAPKDRTWQDPPADRKPVRVIGGATVVPGGTAEAGGAN